MVTGAIASVGTQLKIGDGGSPEAFTAIAEVRNISGPGFDSEEIDCTSLDSTAGFREYIQGFKDGGELSFQLNFIPSQRANIFANYIAGTTHNWQLCFPDVPGTIMSVAAFVKSPPLEIGAGAQLLLNVTLRVTGPPSFNN